MGWTNAVVEDRGSAVAFEPWDRAARAQADARAACEKAIEVLRSARGTRLRAIELRYDTRRSRRERIGPVLCMAAGVPAGEHDDDGPVGELARLLDEVDGLKTAMVNRDVIGQAKGILMERLRVDADGAFELLRQASQHANRKLADVAIDLSRTGQWPPDGDGRQSSA